MGWRRRRRDRGDDTEQRPDERTTIEAAWEHLVEEGVIPAERAASSGDGRTVSIRLCHGRWLP